MSQAASRYRKRERGYLLVIVGLVIVLAAQTVANWPDRVEMTDRLEGLKASLLEVERQIDEMLAVRDEVAADEVAANDDDE